MTRSHKTGFTLVELLIGVVLSMAIGGIVTVVLANHQRLFAHLNDALSVRERLRDATDILAADLRSISATPDAIPFASDTALEFFSVIGASVLCQTPAGTEIHLPPAARNDNATFTGWIGTPDSNDIVAIYHDSGALSPTRGWLRFRILALASAPLASGCPPESGFTSPSDVAAGDRAHVITLQTAPPLAITTGAPLRVLRRARYSIYRASDGFWYLGYRRCHPVTGVCEVVQPISGPYTRGSRPPLTFRYHTQAGPIIAPNASPPPLTRLDIRITGTPKRLAPIIGHETATDSAITIITFRNRTSL